MHFVDRGIEPPQLQAIRQQYTPRWIAYYRNGVGPKPTDTRWRAFQPVLNTRFLDLCGYCEELCKGEVDHFRPKKSFPARVYQWNNWINACHVCNNQKGERWFRGGYVNPCDSRLDHHPERFFDFDTTTGEIVIRSNLSASRFNRALRTRERLKLNALYNLKKRVRYLKIVERALQANMPQADKEQFIADITSRDAEFSSLVRKFLVEKRIPFP